VLKLAEPGEPLVQGDDVQQLQQALIRAGFDLGTSGADGIFGKGTDKALREFQQQKGITMDGIVGAETRRLLGI
jgi:peptidoglycan hydrolase-like protein with peptidoglycan-binding domain